MVTVWPLVVMVRAGLVLSGRNCTLLGWLPAACGAVAVEALFAAAGWVLSVTVDGEVSAACRALTTAAVYSGWVTI